jgi:hypothetical protein
MEMEDDPPQEGELTSRAPTEDDLVALCRKLNELDAKYLIVGGFAIIYSGYARTTTDVDLLMATDLENESKVFETLATLPDQAVRELPPGEVEKYTVVRVADEIPLPEGQGPSVSQRRGAEPWRVLPWKTKPRMPRVIEPQRGSVSAGRERCTACPTIRNPVGVRHP